MTFFKKKKEFRRAYHEFYPVVFSAVYSKTRNKEDTEDICHEVFIRFFKHFDEIERHRNWLMKSIHFELQTFYRKRDNNPDDFTDIDIVSDDPGVYFENGFRDSRIILQEAIEDEKNFKTEKEMILFELVAVYSFTYEEAGGYLGITKWQAEYEYRKVSRRILDHLKIRGIKGIEDLL